MNRRLMLTIAAHGSESMWERLYKGGKTREDDDRRETLWMALHIIGHVTQDRTDSQGVPLQTTETFDQIRYDQL